VLRDVRGAAKAIRAFRTDVLPLFAACDGYRVAVAFLDWLETEIPATVTPLHIAEATGMEVSNAQMFWVLAILSNGVLTAECLFADDDGTRILISNSVIGSALNGKAIVHPRTGRILPDGGARIFLRFRLHGVATEPSVAEMGPD
jgi:hypothetical protein